MKLLPIFPSRSARNERAITCVQPPMPPRLAPCRQQPGAVLATHGGRALGSSVEQAAGIRAMTARFHNRPYATARQILTQSSHSRHARFPAPGREDLRDTSKTSASMARIERGIT